ncbi:hypothetical protein Y032_0084g1784 [Ancylostoma ceylanicum]|uniref:Uncharacterized protein n=1 Tax=Ancylostoma ceylanicum TaxID=53326 RepID=A0A016TQW5_9BILA|nr:hypothetical protein Y032_0084g1784 [Ancylostoma ceylanicum]
MYTYPKWRTRPIEHRESLLFGASSVLRKADTKTPEENAADAPQLKFLHFCSMSLRVFPLGSSSSAENYDVKDFRIFLPDCDLDYNEFFAFFKELICVPRQTTERIAIFNLPKTLIHTIARNVSSFDAVGPALWVEQGLCSHDDIKWTCLVTCECNPNRVLHPIYNLVNELPADSSRICETIRLHLGVSVSKRQEMLKPRERLLNVWITLEAGLSTIEAFIPEKRIFDCSRSQKRRRKGS